MLTLEQLQKIMPNARRRAVDALPILNKVAQQYEINTERRMAMWLATLAAESGELKYQEEIASGAAYEGRTDLGNTQKGDGRRFKGHGRIQITGRTNHTKYTNYLKRSKHLPFIDFVANPARLAEEPYATDAAGWFWTVYKGLNKFADAGDFLTTQVRVNGRNKKTGLPNHYDVRQRYYARGLAVLPSTFSVASNSTAVQTADSSSLESEPAEAPTSPTIQNVEQIINTGDTGASTPAPVDVTLNAPQGMGSVQTATKVTVLGITVPPFILVIVETIKGWISDGFLDAKEIGNTVVSLIKDNSKYILIAAGLVVVVIIIKKITRELIFLVTVITHAIPGWNSITVVAPEKVEPEKKWYQFWK